MINYKSTIKYIVDYDEPFSALVEYMDQQSVTRVPLVFFELQVKQLIDKVNKGTDRQIVDAISKAYSLRNLKQHNFVTHDESNESIALTKFIEMFVRNMSEKMRVKPITDKRFKAHASQLDDILSEANSYVSKTAIDKVNFREYLQDFLSEVKQDFESNKRAITLKTDNLSKLLKSSETQGAQRIIYTKIVELCERYVEPFFQFISHTQDKNGFIPTMVRLREFFAEQEMLDEEAEVGRFILNFASYTKDIQHVYDRINDYRRKGQQDLIVFNGFEKAFNHLSEIVMGMQDGLLVRNDLQNNQDFISTYKQFDNAKADNEKHGNVSINYIDLIEHFANIEKDLVFSSRRNSQYSPLSQDINLERLALDKESASLLRARNQKNKQLILKISKLIKQHFSSFSKLEGPMDIIGNIHQVLSAHIEDYRPFFTLYAYTNIRKKLLAFEKQGLIRVIVGYDQRYTFSYKGINYKYRPILIQDPT
ncbi:hypothetical protein [Pseudoalteromonas piscicida]|uniref:hypothetical protein n=1 Tax=Pseudoalteromonas piscicida TaxID=43662 RepID=UPI000E35EBD0|nr:hypothetical protein [Pseudoalteromonas piscicida]AXQ98990.1 hypothetical protein D0N37_15540 [Pseudoalteromonas piscicida]